MIYSAIYFWMIPVLILIVSGVFSAKDQIVIENHTLYDRFQLLGLNMTETQYEYHELKGILITKKRVVYTANSRGRSGTTDFYEYIGHLLLDDEKVELVRETELQKLWEKLEFISKKLNISMSKDFSRV
ncbi:MAG: hypothetical protein AAF843_07935 [Bacteroidota bacterium]